MSKSRLRCKRVATLLCALAALAAIPTVVAQETPSRSLAQAAGDTVKGAAVSAWDTARDLTSSALELLGVRYKWGGSQPETGLDCSGLVQYVFQQVTGVTLPRSAKDMSQLGDRVALTELKPGDLVFFNTRRFAYSHVGIYLGDNRFIHAPRRGREVEVATIDVSYWKKRFDGARRLVGVLPEMMPALVSEAVAAPLEPPADAESHP